MLLLLFPGRGWAEADLEPAATAGNEPDMQVVLVTGVHSGPALWRVWSGNHTLWLLGEISPYPRKIKWRSKEFDRRLQQSQELLIDFSGYWWADADNEAALDQASRLPEGTKLKDVIAPELYARVEATAAKFGNPSLEPWRPFSATNRLVSAAMKTLDLEGFSVRFSATKSGQWRGKKITYFSAPEIPFEERLLHWQSPENEVCLRRLVDTIGDGGKGLLHLANAWAVGDIQSLRELVPRYSFSRDGFRAGECADAMRGGVQEAIDYKTRRTQAWLAEAKRALEKNRSTMAVVLMSELFEPDGYLAALRAEGFEIVEPK
jgi:hypothetical protein